MTICGGHVPGHALLYPRLLSIPGWSLDTTNFSRPQMPPSYNYTDLSVFSNKKSHLKRSVFQWKLTVLKWKYPCVIINGSFLSLILAPFCKSEPLVEQWDCQYCSDSLGLMNLVLPEYLYNSCC